MERWYREGPGDPGTLIKKYGVHVPNRAATFMVLDFEPDPPPGVIAFADQFRAEFGHDLWPLGMDLSIHSDEPSYDGQERTLECPFVEGGCYHDSTASAAMRLAEGWAANEKDDEFIYQFLEGMMTRG